MRTTSRSAGAGQYLLVYYPHNIHFVWLGATMSGQGRLAVESARKAAASVAPATPEQLPFVQGFPVVPTTRSCDSAGGTRSSPSRSLSRLALYPRDLALRARVGVCRDRSGRQGRAGAPGARDHRDGPGAGENAGVFAQSA